MKLPQNKLARLAINVVFIVFWWLIANIFPEVSGITFWAAINGWEFMGSLPHYIVTFVPMALATRYIWWGRPFPKRIEKLFSNKRFWSRVRPRP